MERFHYNQDEMRKKFGEWSKGSENHLIRRFKTDPQRLFMAREFNKGAVIERSYYVFNPREGFFNNLAIATFINIQDTYIPRGIFKFGSDQTIELDFVSGMPGDAHDFQGAVIAVQLAPPFYMKFECGYSQDGVLDGIQLPRAFGAGPYLTLDGKRLISVLRGKDVSRKIENTKWRFFSEQDEDTRKIFLCLESQVVDQGMMLARVPVQIPTDLAERLFPGEVFGVDPYEVHPSDDRWVQTDLQTMLGGFHWEQSVILQGDALERIDS